MVEEIAQRFVHALNQRGERLGIGGLAGIFVMRGETRIRLER